MPPAITPTAPTSAVPATPTATPAAPVNTSLFAQPGENFAQYEARVAGGNSGNIPGTPTAPATPATPATPTDTSAEDQVAQSLGYKNYADATAQLTAAPTQSETDLYNQAYSAAGLDQLQNTITGRQNDLATAQNNIDDNPWLDESDRVGRNKTVTDLANADIKNYQDAYTNGLKEVEDLVTRESADNTATTTANKAKLAALEAQAKELATQNATTAKAATTAPKTVKGASGATYQWDAASGTIKQILPAKAASTSTASKPTQQQISTISSALQSVAGPDGFVSPQSWQDALNEWTAAGLPASTFISTYKNYANTKDKTNNYAGL